MYIHYKYIHIFYIYIYIYIFIYIYIYHLLFDPPAIIRILYIKQHLFQSLPQHHMSMKQTARNR